MTTDYEILAAKVRKAQKKAAKRQRKAEKQAAAAAQAAPVLFKSIAADLANADPAQREIAIRALAALRTDQDYSSPYLPASLPGPARDDPLACQVALEQLRDPSPATREMAWAFLHPAADD
jgi:hypothetical protein